MGFRSWELGDGSWELLGNITESELLGLRLGEGVFTIERD
jgi:hypothetical protein